MTRVEYYLCDRCGKKMNIVDMAIVIFMGKQKELCKKCQEDFKVWLKDFTHKEKKDG